MAYGGQALGLPASSTEWLPMCLALGYLGQSKKSVCSMKTIEAVQVFRTSAKGQLAAASEPAWRRPCCM
jgi:hypothetical protein